MIWVELAAVAVEDTVPVADIVREDPAADIVLAAAEAVREAAQEVEALAEALVEVLEVPQEDRQEILEDHMEVRECRHHHRQGGECRLHHHQEDIMENARLVVAADVYRP